MENGLTEEKISELDHDSNTFSRREQLALVYAEKLAIDHRSADDAFFDELRTEFSDAEIIELGMMAGQYIGFGRLLMVLDLTPKFCPADGGDVI
jgi:alkylhydroperoxidase family enzyme